ncbi:hypothetical protein [Pseudomonas sp. NPDC086278]
MKMQHSGRARGFKGWSHASAEKCHVLLEYWRDVWSALRKEAGVR